MAAKKATGNKRSKKAGRVTRPKNAMPAWVKRAISARGLMRAYKERPNYQQNDYLGWIDRAALEATKKKRLDQMLDELERGGVYMRMRWSPLKVRAAKKKKETTKTKKRAAKRA